MLEDLEQNTIKAKTIRDRDMVKLHVTYEDMLNLFVKEIEAYDLEIKGRLQKVLPEIRSGIKGELALNELLRDYQRSSFNSDDTSLFLSRRSQELNLLGFILD